MTEMVCYLYEILVALYFMLSVISEVLNFVSKWFNTVYSSVNQASD